jgi:hypothetical protein
MWLLNSVSGMLNGVIGDTDCMYITSIVVPKLPHVILVLCCAILGCYEGCKLKNARTDTATRV